MALLPLAVRTELYCTELYRLPLLHSLPARPPTPLPPCSFIIYNGASDLLGGSDVGVLVGCLTGLLKHTDLVTSPPVHLSIVQLLLAMLSPQVGAAGGRP